MPSALYPRWCLVYLGECTCMQRRRLDVPCAVMRVRSADIDDGVVLESSTTAMDDDVALPAAAVVVGTVVVVWDVLV